MLFEKLFILAKDFNLIGHPVKLNVLFQPRISGISKQKTFKRICKIHHMTTVTVAIFFLQASLEPEILPMRDDIIIVLEKQ